MERECARAAPRRAAPPSWKVLAERIQTCVGTGSKHRKRLARTPAGNSESDFGGEPRGPNDVRSSHSAVILVSAKTGGRVTMELSGSTEAVCTPNSISLNRRSISCCSRATASWMAADGGAMEEDPQNLTLTCMRLDARAMAGAQTASEAKPRRSRRRGTTREPTVGNPQTLLMSTRRQLHPASADADDGARLSNCSYALHSQF